VLYGDEKGKGTFKKSLDGSASHKSLRESAEAIRKSKKQEKLQQVRDQANWVLFMADQKKPSADALAFEQEGTPIVDLEGNQLLKAQVEALVSQFAEKEQMTHDDAIAHLNKRSENVQLFVNYMLANDKKTGDDSD